MLLSHLKTESIFSRFISVKVMGLVGGSVQEMKEMTGITKINTANRLQITFEFPGIRVKLLNDNAYVVCSKYFYEHWMIP